MKISLLHPFSAKAIGLKEEDLVSFHSIPHKKYLHELKKNNLHLNIYVNYFTTKKIGHSKYFNNIKLKFCPITNLQNRGAWRSEHSYIHYISNFFFPPDITIINMSGHGSKYVFKLAKLLKKKNKKYIAMIGGMNTSLNPLIFEYYKNAEFIIVHTEIQKKALLRDDFFSKLTIKVLPLGVDTSIFKPKKIKDKKKKILFVGRVSRLKQVEIAIKTLFFLRKNGLNYTLDIVGPTHDRVYFLELELLIKKLEIADFVVFKGEQNQQKLITYYQESKVLLLPSLHESFGMVITEAMACKTPVIALKGAGGPEEIISHKVNGILTSSENYSKEVFNLITNNEMYDKLSDNCLIAIRNKWSQNKCSKLFESLMKSLI